MEDEMKQINYRIGSIGVLPVDTIKKLRAVMANQIKRDYGSPKVESCLGDASSEFHKVAARAAALARYKANSDLLGQWLEETSCVSRNR